MRSLLFFLVASLISNSVYSQLDTRHYIPPAYARADDASDAGDDIYLVLSTPQVTAFNVSITDGAGNAMFAPVSISRSAPVTLALSTAAGASKGTGTKFLVTAAQLATVISNEGLILTANKAFFASIRIDEAAQAESVTARCGRIWYEFRSGHVWNDGDANNLNRTLSVSSLPKTHNVTVSDFDNLILKCL